ncbi:MAG: hypothetical protein AABX11_04435 [Nanoarchaeota archaeon]
MAINKIKGEIQPWYPLDTRYRLFRPIFMDNVLGVEGRIQIYGPYHASSGVVTDSPNIEGMKDFNSWDALVKSFIQGARIFAKLPIHEDDLNRVIESRKQYLVVNQFEVEKDEKPWGYGTSDYFHTYEFRNVGKSEAFELIKELVSKGCSENRLNVGLELKVRDEEIQKIVREKDLALKRRVMNILK